jgi:hypothetical protein
VPVKTSGNDFTRWDQRVRDAALFVIAFAALANELFILPEPRPTALYVIGVLLGFPLALRQDERRRKANGD